MPVRIGEFGITVRLDTTEAVQKAREIEERNRRQDRSRQEIKRKIERDEPETTPGKPQKRSVLEQMVAAQARRTASGNVVSGRLAAGIAAGRAATGAMSGGGAAATALKTGAVAAVTYAAASASFRAAPSGVEFIKKFLPEALEDSELVTGLMQEMEEFRAGFIKLESTVAAIFSAYSQTKDLGTAAVRLTGQMPDLVGLYDQNIRAESAQKQLERKFKHEINDDVAEALGGILNKSLKQAMSQ